MTLCYFTGMGFLPSLVSAEWLDVDIQAKGGVLFDDNVTFAKQSKKQDVITQLSLGLGAQHEGKIHQLDVQGTLTQQLFASHHEFSNLSQELLMRWKAQVNPRDQFTLGNTLSHAEEPRSFEDEFGRTAGRYNYFRNRLNLEYTRTFTQQFLTRWNYDNERNVFSRSDLRDSWLHRALLETGYALNSASLLLGTYEVAYRTFDLGAHTYTQRVAPGLRQYIRPSVWVDVLAGVDILHDFDGDDPIKPRLSAVLNHEPDALTLTRALFDYGYSTTAFTESLFRSWRATLDFRRQLRKRLGCTLSGFYGRGAYVTRDIDETLGGAFTQLRYEVSEHVQGTLSYRFSIVDADEDSLDYVKNVVFLGITMTL